MDKVFRIRKSLLLLFCLISHNQADASYLKKAFLASLMAVGILSQPTVTSTPPADITDVCPREPHDASHVLTETCPLPPLVYLEPPYADETDFVVQTACDRPRRSDGIKISREEIGNKTVIHCYGHGGSGFTTLFGSIKEALTLFKKNLPSTDTVIHIIGSGCMGLTMAVELFRQGFTNIIISTKDRYNIPSWRAGGFFDPGTGSETSPADRLQLRLGLETHTTLHAIENGQHPYLPRSIARQLPLYYPADIEAEVEVLEKLALVPASERVTIDFGDGVTHQGYKRQMTYFIDVTTLMKRLWRLIEEFNIPVVDEEIHSLADCPESIVINTSGLGSRELNNDSALYPGRGHFFMLKTKPHAKTLDYMLFTKVQHGDRKDYIYFFPKQALVSASGEVATRGMLGGTSIPYKNMTKAELEQLDKTEYDRLAERSHEFFLGLHKRSDSSSAPASRSLQDITPKDVGTLDDVD